MKGLLTPRSRTEAFRWVVGLVLVLAVLSHQALSPREDWYDTPFVLFPLRFHGVLGGFGGDKIEHVVAISSLTAAFGRAYLAFGDEPRALRRAWLTVQLWCTLVEIIQGFLPYRNFEAFDLVANLVGGAVGVAVGRLIGAATPPDEAPPIP